MAFHDPLYDVFVLKGTADSPAPWVWDTWTPWAKALAPFTATPRGKPAVRSTQWSHADKKYVRFGKLSWDDKSHQRWTHGSPGTREDSTQWEFLHVEAWAPGWTACERESRAPDFFFSLRNPHMGATDGRKPYPFIVCALATSSDDERRRELARALLECAKALPAVLFATKRRPWGIAALGGFTHSIQSMDQSVLSGTGDPEAPSFNQDRRPETWTLIDVA